MLKKKDEYVRMVADLRDHLMKIASNDIVSVKSLSSALMYVLERRLKTRPILYNSQYGEIDFSVGVIRFRLQWPPISQVARLICKHIEGIKFVDTPFNPMSNDPITDLLGTIDFCLEYVSPFDI